jgi:hypothetical protein
MAIKFSQFVVETSASTMSHIVGYDGADNIQITPNNFFTSFVTGTTGQVPFFGSTTSLLGDAGFNWDNTNKRLGIGTSSPSAKLEIAGGADSIVLVTGTTIASRLDIKTNSHHRFLQTIESDGRFRLFNQATNTEQLSVLSGGNVGIGTTSPGTTLDVAGTLASSGITQLGTGGSNVLLTSTGAGNVGIGNNSPNRKLTVSSSGVIADFISSSTSSYVDIVGSSAQLRAGVFGGVVGFANGTGTTAELAIDTSGNVGIGTSSPSSTLTLGNATDNVAELRVLRSNGSSSTYASVNTIGGTGQFGSSGSTRVYSTGNEKLNLRTNGSDRLTILSGGNVGIGTTSPTARLNVKSSGSNLDEISLTHSGNTVNIASLGQESGHGSLVLRNNSGAIQTRLSAGGNNSYILNSNVGIGTSSPVTKLQVDSASDFSVALSKRGSTSSALKFTLSNPATTTNTWKIEHDASENLKIFGYSADNLLISTNSTERMRITSAGNVGIGTTSPDHKLEVQGVISSADAGLQKATFANVGNDLVLTANADQTNVTAKILFNSSGSGGGAVSTKMIIDGAGNVGIGTPNPAGKLHVKDVGAIYTSLSGSDSTVNFIENGGNPWRIGNRSSDDSFRFSQSSTSLGTNVRVTFADGGNVGIGTSSPSVKTHIQGGNAVTGAFYDGSTVLAVEDTNPYMQIIGTDGGNQASSLILTTVPAAGTGNNKHWAVQHRGTTQNGNFGISYDTTSASGQDGADGTDLFVINTTGNVGIGTTSPTAKLTVVGLAEHADNAAAISAGLTTGAFYRTGDLLKVVH